MIGTSRRRLAAGETLADEAMIRTQLRCLALVLALAGCHGYSLTPQNLRRSATRPAAASRLCVVAMADDLSKLTVKQLKEKLKDAGLPVSGKKAELIERLGAGGSAPPAAARCLSLIHI